MKRKLLVMVITLGMVISLIPAFMAQAQTNIKIGDYVQMGRYNGEPILWRCVDIDENGPLMLADKILTFKAFDATGTHKYLDGTAQPDSRRILMGSNLWETSNLRSWLNSTEMEGNVEWLDGCPPTEEVAWDGYNEYADEKGFLAGGNFTENEKKAIKSVNQKSLLNQVDVTKLKVGGTASLKNYTSISTIVQNYDSAYYQNVTDRMFLLDIKQVNKVYQNEAILGAGYYIGKPTQNAVDNSEGNDGSLDVENNCLYWLRTPQSSSSYSEEVQLVYNDGNVHGWTADYYKSGVRPAFYMDMSTTIYKKGSGSVNEPYVADTVPNQKVSYDANGCNEGLAPIDETNYSEGDMVTVVGNTGNLVKTGYTFAGWNTEADGSGTEYSAGTGTFLFEGSPVTLYAIWNINCFNVNYDSQSGSEVMGTTANYNTKLTKPTAPTYLGYIFCGWYKDASCTNAWDFLTDVVTTEDITLYAKWMPGVSAINIGDYVQMGKYYGDPILWRCVDIDENGPLMLADKILTIKPFDAKGAHKYLDGTTQADDVSSYRTNLGSNLWETSNMRCWLNSTEAAGSVVWIDGCAPIGTKVENGYNDYATENGFMADGNFTQNERKAIKTVTQKSLLNEIDVTKLKAGGTEIHTYNKFIYSVTKNYDNAYYQNVTDKMFLLDVMQVYKIYQNSDILGANYYMSQPTQKAVDNSELKKSALAVEKNYTYWLRSPNSGFSSSLVRTVTADDFIGLDHASYSSGIRPAFYMDISTVIYIEGNGSVEEPYVARTPIALTVSGLTADKIYDGENTATLNTTGVHFSGVEDGDSVTLDITNATATFNDKNVGEGKTVTISGLALSGENANKYTIEPTITISANITAKTITPTVSAKDKVYDGTTEVNAVISLPDVADNDDVEATGTVTFEDENAGLKTVNAKDISLSGADKDNYTLSTTTAKTTANINPKKIEITMADASFEYDSTAKELIAANDYGVAMAYTNNTKTDAGIYTVTATTNNPNYSGSSTAKLTITQKELTIEGISAVTKTYDGTTVADITGGILTGKVGEDDVSANIPTSGKFSSKNIGTGIGVSIEKITLSGTKADNYYLTQPKDLKADINAKILKPSAITQSKVYNRTTTSTTTILLSGIVNKEDVSATGTATFEDANVGIKTVNVREIALIGEDKNNYVLSETTVSTTAEITAKALTITPNSNQSKVYGDNDPVLTYITEGLISGDALAGALSRETGENIGNYQVTLGTLTNSNYAITIIPINFLITPKTLTITGIVITDKTYDGTTNAKNNVTGANLDGVVNGDELTIDQANMTAVFDNKDIGTNKTVTITKYKLSGIKAGNYILIQPTGITGNIIAEIPSDMTVTLASVNAGMNSYDSTWTKEDVVFTLSGSAPSGISKYQYSIDDGATWTDLTTNVLTVNETTDDTYMFRVISNGNIASNPSTPVILKVDKTKPIVENITGNPTEPKNTEQIITFTVKEINSGINNQTITIKKDDTSIPFVANEGLYSFTTQGNGKYQINVSDNVTNNAEEMLVNVTKLDFEKPTISTLSPLNNKENVDVDSFTASFNEKIKKSDIHGDIIVYSKDGTEFEKIDIQNNRIKISNEQLKIYFTKPLERSTSYYITIADDIVLDLAGNTFDGFTGSTIWAFTTNRSSVVNRLIGVSVTILGEQYSAIADPIDDTKYTTIAKANTNGTVDAVISPTFLTSGASLVITTEEEGVTINRENIKIDYGANKQVTLNLQIKNPNGTLNTTKLYTLTIQKGEIETKIDNISLSANVRASDLIGAVDVSSYVEAGKQMQLVLDVSNNESSLSPELKEKLENAVGDQNIAMFIDVNLNLNNVTDNTTTPISNTQNPITIIIEIPSDMQSGSNYKIVRYHNGVVEIIDAFKNGKYLIFTTDRFSQYAIAYTEPEEPSRNTNNSSGSSITITEGKHSPYIKGYSDNTFKPQNNITRAEVTTILSRLSGSYSETKYYANDFSDVTGDGWYANSIGFCRQNDLIKGYSDGSFKPNKEMTRAEFAVIIAKFKNLSIADNENLPFSDISGHWAEAYIAAMYKQGWVTGYPDGTFQPDATITRAEAVKIINVAIGRTPSKDKANKNISKYTNPFSDVVKEHWAYCDILEATISHTVSDFN